MQAIEATGTINLDGSLSLDQPLEVGKTARVRVIVIVSETESAESGAIQAGSETVSKISGCENLSYDPTAQPIWELVAEVSAQVPDEEWAKLPTDLASNFDYYQQQRDDV